MLHLSAMHLQLFQTAIGLLLGLSAPAGHMKCILRDDLLVCQHAGRVRQLHWQQGGPDAVLRRMPMQGILLTHIRICAFPIVATYMQVYICQCMTGVTSSTRPVATIATAG